MTADIPVPAAASAPLDTARALLGELIAFPTVSADSNLALVEWARSRLAPMGARLQITPSACGTKANLFASLGPPVDGGVVLSGHSDVVPVEGQVWSVPPFAMTERDGRLHGRGSCDMKGFLACVFALAPRFAAAPLRRPVHVALSHDEEVGCRGAPAMIAAMVRAGIRPSVCLVGEPTEMRVVAGHKGMCEYTTRFTGLAGHGSDPDAGVSAVEHAARFVARLLELRAVLAARVPPGSGFVPPHSTLQIGRIAGGLSHNVIADHAVVEWELRPVSEADWRLVMDAMAACVQGSLLPAMRAVHPAASIETETIGEVVGLTPRQGCPAAALATALTGENAVGLVPFGTEAGLFQQAGIPTVLCGPGSIAQAHKADEYVETAQLARCLAMLERLADHLMQPG